jgi:hypothetical protein
MRFSKPHTLLTSTGSKAFEKGEAFKGDIGLGRHLFQRGVLEPSPKDAARAEREHDDAIMAAVPTTQWRGANEEA